MSIGVERKKVAVKVNFLNTNKYAFTYLTGIKLDQLTENLHRVFIGQFLTKYLTLISGAGDFCIYDCSVIL